MHRVRCVAFLGLAAFVWPAAAQEPAATAPAQPPTGAAAATLAATGKPKHSHANDFLIRGSVFTDKALSFPGVKLRVRRTGDKKFRWEDSTNSRGEFAIRVPQGAEYEMVVHARGFTDQAQVVDAKSGDGVDKNLVFRMRRSAGGKR